jgi:signal transduction histidine kinase
VNADADALERIVQNLVDNAVQHGGPGVSVRVTVEQDDGRVRLTVTDNGPGMPSELVPRMFERFTRGAAGRASDSGGTGLGLAIARQLAESQGGALTAQSELGQGATFTLEFPA